MSIEELGKFLPVVLINRNYIITSINESARSMLGDAVGKKCYQVLYGLEKPCPEFNIKCPVASQEEGIDTVHLGFEVYLRSFGRLPFGGISWESPINITSLSVIRASVYDPLTGLYSPSFIKGMLEKLFYMWKRYGEIFSLLLIDIDDMGKINKEFGHLTGDEAIKKVGQSIKLCSRKADIVVRLKEDKFIVVLPKTDKEDAIVVARRIQKSVQELPFVSKLSVSIALVDVSREERGVDALMEKANRIMKYLKERYKGSIAYEESRGVYKVVK